MLTTISPPFLISLKRIRNTGSYRLSSRYSLTAKIPSFEKDKLGTDISKKISPQESPIDRQAKCLEHYGPHTVENIGEAILGQLSTPASLQRIYILLQSGISDSDYHPSISQTDFLP